MYHSISHILSPSSHLMTSERTGGRAFPLTTPGVKLLLASHRRPLSLPYPHAGGRAPPQRCYLAAAAKLRLARSLRSHLSGAAGCRAYSVCLRARPYAHTPCRAHPCAHPSSRGRMPPPPAAAAMDERLRSSACDDHRARRRRMPTSRVSRAFPIRTPSPLGPHGARKAHRGASSASNGALATSLRLATILSLSPFLSPTWLRYRECYRPVAGALR
jgi:hypothetical protein